MIHCVLVSSWQKELLPGHQDTRFHKDFKETSMKKRRLIVAIVAVVLIVAGVAAVLICNRSSNEVDGAEGSMNVICPITVYSSGDVLKSPCPLKPGEECSYFDEHNCQNIMKNVGNESIEKGVQVQVIRQKIQGITQHLEVLIPYQ